MCLFCQIVEKSIAARIINEDDHHLAFLTPFPNTDGFSVVITKEHYSSYIFDLPEPVFQNLMRFSKETAALIDKKLGVRRTGLICEGMGIDHAHTKLVPLHGIPPGDWQPVRSTIRDFYEVYPGFIASHDSHMQNEERINAIYQKLIT